MRFFKARRKKRLISFKKEPDSIDNYIRTLDVIFTDICYRIKTREIVEESGASLESIEPRDHNRVRIKIRATDDEFELFKRIFFERMTGAREINFNCKRYDITRGGKDEYR